MAQIESVEKAKAKYKDSDEENNDEDDCANNN